ncbi:pantoate--beta-alanine ligase [Varibaculum vaginae]|uniref:pantoate--beta-alanine ligase n=1 Tax=Varibaculum vaginae TaxID=2364797 RepID=UPI000F089145|nr:pantoate--beta-alanine ligase [Varibaculum vaginae]
MNNPKEPLVVHDRQTLARAERNVGTVGLIVTRGNWHRGHQAAFSEASGRVDSLVASVYTDPVGSAFETTSDMISAADFQLAARSGVDIIFAPSTEAFYPFGTAQTVLDPGKIIREYEAAHNPQQALNRLTQLVKMLGIVRPDKVFIGQCDAQLLATVRLVVRDLDIPVMVEALPTFRDLDGLTVSQTTLNLSPAQREDAAVFAKALFAGVSQAAATGSGAAVMAATRDVLSDSGVEIEYLDLVDPISFEPWQGDGASTACLIAAVKLGEVRLSDNQLVVLSRL